MSTSDRPTGRPTDRPTRRTVIKSGAALIAAPAVLQVTPALAAYPERPVRIVVANSPGGPSDIIARIMAAELQKTTGGTFVVDNRGGAGGNIGMGFAARSEPDGYTILLTTSAYVVNPGLYLNLPYDPLKSFSAICELASSPNIFTCKPELGVKTLKEFAALAKKAPDKFNVSAPPIGTTPQVAAEVFKSREGLQKMATVVFTGGGEAIKALLSGTVQLSSGALPPSHPHVKAGTIVGLAVTGSTRWHDLPNVPTMKEAGYDDFVFETYTALLAPAKTPPDIVAWLEKEALAILKRPDMKERLEKSGFQVQAKTGKGHMDRIVKEVPMFKQILAQAGMKPK